MVGAESDTASMRWAARRARGRRAKLRESALAWSVAQLGWVAGPLALAGFACVTYYTSTLLANAYGAPHPVTCNRNRTYKDAVIRSYLSTRRRRTPPPLVISLYVNGHSSTSRLTESA